MTQVDPAGVGYSMHQFSLPVRSRPIFSPPDCHQHAGSNSFALAGLGRRFLHGASPHAHQLRDRGASPHQRSSLSAPCRRGARVRHIAQTEASCLEAAAKLPPLDDDSFELLLTALFQQQRHGGAIELAAIIAQLAFASCQFAHFRYGYALQLANRHGAAIAPYRRISPHIAAHSPSRRPGGRCATTSPVRCGSPTQTRTNSNRY